MALPGPKKKKKYGNTSSVLVKTMMYTKKIAF